MADKREGFAVLTRQTPRRPLRTDDIVEMLDVTPMTVYNWRRGGKDYKPLPCKTVPRGERNRVFFMADDLDQWLRENKPDLLPKWTKNHDGPARLGYAERNAAA